LVNPKRLRIRPSFACVPHGSASNVRFASARERLISSPRVPLARLDADLAARVRIDLAEEAHLDLAGEEAVLEAGEGAALGLLDALLGDVADEVAGDADVEEELARAAPVVGRRAGAGGPAPGPTRR
jgi:hypothetical protein